MEKKTLVGVNGNAYCVMGTVSGWMKEAYKNASIPDEDGQVDEVAMKLFDSDAIEAYTKDATSSDYNHLLCVSCEMVDKINEYWEQSPAFDGWDEEDEEDEEDYWDDEDDDWDQYIADNAYGSDTD